MRMRVGLMALVAPAVLAGVAAAQTPSEDRLEQLEQRLSAVEAQLKDRDAEIERLRSQARSQSTTAPADDIDRTRADVLADIESRQAASASERKGVDFNPDIAVILDVLGSWSPQRSNEAYNRLDLREAEIDFRAAIDPRADGVLIVAFGRDVHNPIFAEAHDDEGEGEDEEHEEGVENHIGIEEGYLFLHDFGVPNLTAKLGRYRLRFGRQNMLHLHDLPTPDAPFVVQSYLGPEGLSDAGLSLSYVVPNPMDQYIEGIIEIISGEGDDESPLLNGGLAADSPALNTHLLWNTDLVRNLNLELGGSWLIGHGDEDNALDLQIFGADVTLLRTDPTGGFNNQVLQAEAMHAIVDHEDGDTTRTWGAYLLAQQQLNKDWYVGARLDWVQNPEDEDEEVWGISPYVSWYWSEFLRFRVMYQRKDGDIADPENVLYLQATAIFGAHPPHPYWSMR